MKARLNVEVDALNLGSLQRGLNGLVKKLRHLVDDARELQVELDALTTVVARPLETENKASPPTVNTAAIAFRV